MVELKKYGGEFIKMVTLRVHKKPYTSVQRISKVWILVVGYVADKYVKPCFWKRLSIFLSKGYL